jgi:hypothetical protein
MLPLAALMLCAHMWLNKIQPLRSQEPQGCRVLQY